MVVLFGDKVLEVSNLGFFLLVFWIFLLWLFRGWVLLIGDLNLSCGNFCSNFCFRFSIFVLVFVRIRLFCLCLSKSCCWYFFIFFICFVCICDCVGIDMEIVEGIGSDGVINIFGVCDLVMVDWLVFCCGWTKEVVVIVIIGGVEGYE